MEDLKTFGFMFETLAVRDLRVYADAHFGDVRHYHDASGLECDAVVSLRDGRYGLIEVKLGMNSRVLPHAVEKASAASPCSVSLTAFSR